MIYPHPIIAKEGWLFIALSIAIALAIQICFGLGAAFIFWLVVIFVIQFFRDPARTISGGENSVLAPADGRIILIEQTTDPYLNCKAIKVSIFMNVFNVHSQRSPVDGEVIARWYQQGSFLNAALDKASEQNERNALHIMMNGNRNITCVQVAGLVARRIKCYVGPGATLKRGERYGFIRFGSRLDLYLPTSAHVKVTIGEKVKAATTIVAEFA